jgi:Tfp pilus assembly PilM family ATPase
MAKTAWGIELGTSSVKAVRITGDRGSATLEEVEILSLRDFGQVNSSAHDTATSAALADLRSRKGIRKGDQVFVSISGQNTLGRIISLPPVSDDRIRETILNEARSQIPIKLEEAVWDYQGPGARERARRRGGRRHGPRRDRS